GWRLFCPQGPAGKFLALISVECQQFWKSQQGQWLMVNGDVMGTGFASFTLAKAAGTRHAVGAVSRQIPLLLMP
ncbi:MAG: hypothetical protein WAK36_21865, partial [Pseudolabrys sp.]